MPVGRPSGYSFEIVQAICDRLAEGELLSVICREDDMPSHATVHRWLEKYPEARSAYEVARRRQAAAFADEALEVGRAVTDPVSAARAKSVSWVALQLAAKADPARYGDRLALDHTTAAVKRVLLDGGPAGELPRAQGPPELPTGGVSNL